MHETRNNSKWHHSFLSASSLPEIKFGDLESGELYDMFLLFRPCTHGKRDVRGALGAKNSFRCIHHSKHHNVELSEKRTVDPALC